MTSAPSESSARIRLDAVASTLDGFELSKIDLEQRREGDVLGTHQSGGKSHLRLLRVLRDESLIEAAREDAATLLENGLHDYPLLASQLAQIQSAATAEFIDKA